MINLNSISVVALSLLLGSNITTDLNHKPASTSAIQQVAKAQAAVIIDDFTQEIYSWWVNSDEKFKLEREEEVLKVTVKSAGAGTNAYDCFGRQFDAIDFSKNQAVKMKIKAEKPCKFRMDLKDANGYGTNSKPITKTLKGGEWETIYFDYTNRWEQGWPEKQPVDNVEVVELLMFVNPGGPEYKGSIHIDDITAIPASEVPQQK